MKTELRYAVIGAGGIAHNHARDFLARPGVRLVGYADPSEASRKRYGDAFGGEAFGEPEAMLEATRPDVVSVCTPNQFHQAGVLAALRHGAHVVCEKPMAMTVAEAEEMEAARAAAGRHGVINFSYRNVPAFRFARELIAGGELGAIHRINAVYLQSWLGAAATQYSWRNDASLAGFGALGDLGVHMIDGVRYLTGLDYRRVVGLAQVLVPEKADAQGVMQRVTADTNAAFLAEMGAGVVAVFETTQVAPGFGNHFRIEISGDRGTLSVCSEDGETVKLFAGAGLTKYGTWKTSIPAVPVPSTFVRETRPKTPAVIVDLLRGGDHPHPTFADGVAAQRVLGALLTSMQTGAWATA